VFALAKKKKKKKKKKKNKRYIDQAHNNYVQKKEITGVGNRRDNIYEIDMNNR